MRGRALGFASLLAVIGVSIVFGMLVGGRLNAPQVSLAAPAAAFPASRSASAAATGASPLADFADIVEAAMPAVVSVRSAVLPGKREAGGGEEEEEQPTPRIPGPEEWFRYWFGDPGPDPDSPRRRPTQPQIGEGSGFIIADDGYLLTNNHVVQDADDIRVRLQDGKEFKAKVVGTDPSIDLALLKVDPKGERLPTLPLGDSAAVRVGEWVIAIGNPQELEQTVTVGVVSAKERRVPVGNTDAGVVSFIQTDAAINFGNSGGPLLDARGQVIGINTAIRRMNLAEGIGFALPINQARNAIEQLRDRGFVKRGYIGITMNQDGLDETAREWLGLDDDDGVIVDDVTAGGPADKAGVRKGDVIRKVDDQVVKDNPDLIGKIASRQPGDKVRLEIFRKDGERARSLTVTATLGDRQEGLLANEEPTRRPTESREEPPREEATGLGITVKNPSTAERRRLGIGAEVEGVLVVDVEYNSAAADKGLAPGMLITAINGQPVGSVDAWTRVVEGLRAGSPCKVDVKAGADRALSFYLRVPAPE